MYEGWLLLKFKMESIRDVEPHSYWSSLRWILFFIFSIGYVVVLCVSVVGGKFIFGLLLIFM